MIYILVFIILILVGFVVIKKRKKANFEVEKELFEFLEFASSNKLNDLSDVNPHLIKEIEHFFQVYKDLENKKVDVEGWGDVNEAKEILMKCTNRFNELENKPEGLFSIK
jgi:hypothetical protein